VADGLPEAALLVKELLNFKVRITDAANETFGAWREGQRDDTVLAVALAAWLGGREPPTSPPRFLGGGFSLPPYPTNSPGLPPMPGLPPEGP
jgi:hypothetical protein